MASASLAGSLASSGLGLPWPTSQNGQRRVQISPMIIKVAVPPLKHSFKLGQLASSHTDDKPFLRSSFLMRSTAGEAATRTRIQSGLRRVSTASVVRSEEHTS